MKKSNWCFLLIMSLFKKNFKTSNQYTMNKEDTQLILQKHTWCGMMFMPVPNTMHNVFVSINTVSVNVSLDIFWRAKSVWKVRYHFYLIILKCSIEHIKFYCILKMFEYYNYKKTNTFFVWGLNVKI